MTGKSNNNKVTTTTTKTTKCAQKKNTPRRNKTTDMNIIVQATAAKSHTSGPGRLSPGKGGTTVTHREIVATITGDIVNGVVKGNSVVSRMSFGTQPGQLSPATWVGRLAGNFDRFKVVKATYEYIPLLPHTAGGATIMRYDPDPFQQRGTDFITESANQNARSKQVYLANKLTVLKNQLNRLPSYICQPGADADSSVGEAGSCHLTTSDVLLLSNATAKSYNLGHLWLDYQITFMNPSQNTSTSPPNPNPTPGPAPTPTPSGEVLLFPKWQDRLAIIGVNKSEISQDEVEDSLSGTPMPGILGGSPNFFEPITDDPSITLKDTGLKLDTKYAAGFVDTASGNAWTSAKFTLFGSSPPPLFDKLDIRGFKIDSDGDQSKWWESISFLNGSGLDELTDDQAKELYGANSLLYLGGFFASGLPLGPSLRFALKEVKPISARSHKKVYIQARAQGLIGGI